MVELVSCGLRCLRWAKGLLQPRFEEDERRAMKFPWYLKDLRCMWLVLPFFCSFGTGFPCPQHWRSASDGLFKRVHTPCGASWPGKRPCVGPKPAFPLIDVDPCMVDILIFLRIRGSRPVSWGSGADSLRLRARKTGGEAHDQLAEAVEAGQPRGLCPPSELLGGLKPRRST